MPQLGRKPGPPAPYSCPARWAAWRVQTRGQTDRSPIPLGRASTGQGPHGDQPLVLSGGEDCSGAWGSRPWKEWVCVPCLAAWGSG